jgi:hypothetical protein
MSAAMIGATGRITWTIFSLVVVEAIVCAVSAVPVTAAVLWLADEVPDSRAWRVTLISLAIVPSYAVFALTLMIVTPLAVRMTGWRTPPEAEMRIADCGWPLLGWVRFMAAIHVARFFAGGLLRGTPLWSWHLQLCGAKIGRRVYINSLSVSDYNLLEFGDEVVVGGAAHVSGHTVEAGVVRTGSVRLGRGVTIGLGSIVEIDTDVAEGCQIGAMSFVPKHSRIVEPGVYVGTPATRLPRLPQLSQLSQQGAAPPVFNLARSDK